MERANELRTATAGDQIIADDVDLYADELTTTQAAALAHVPPGSITAWKARGILRPVSHHWRTGHPRYRGIDVLEAERRTRQSPKSHRRQEA